MRVRGSRVETVEGDYITRPPHRLSDRNNTPRKKMTETPLETKKVSVRRALHDAKVPFNDFIPLTFDNDRSRNDAMMNLLGKLHHVTILVRRRMVNGYEDGMGLLYETPLRLFVSFADDEEDILFEDLTNKRKDVQIDAPSVLNIREDDPFGDDKTHLFFERWSWYLPMFLKHEGRAETVRMLKSVARNLPEPPEDANDDCKKLIALLDLLYVHAETRPDVVGQSGGGGADLTQTIASTTTTRHVPVVPWMITIDYQAHEEKLFRAFRAQAPRENEFSTRMMKTKDDRTLVVYDESSDSGHSTLYVEAGDSSRDGVVVRNQYGRLAAFEKRYVDVDFKPTSYENLQYEVTETPRNLNQALRFVDMDISWLPSFSSSSTVANTNVPGLMVASKDAGEYTHFIDSRGSDAFPKWVKAMRHATQDPKYVLTLALTPFGKEQDGLATAILRPQPDGYEEHLFMDNLWERVQFLVYPIPRAKGSLDSLGIMECPIPENDQNAIRQDPADGEYIVLEGPDDITSWSQNLVPLNEFVIMGYLYRANESGDNTPVNVVALRHKTFPVIKKHPTYPMKMHMKEGGISHFPHSGYVTHLAIVSLPYSTDGVIHWELGKEFDKLTSQTPRLTEGENTNAVNIFYDIITEGGRSIQIFPLSGSVLRVKHTRY